MALGKKLDRKFWKAAHRQQTGFVYIAVLVALMLVALATQGVMTSVAQQAQREREDALLRIGQMYVEAIGRYYQASPGVQKQWPRTLDDLLEDKRLISVQRHIRELYPDPISRNDWTLILAPSGGVQGVASSSMAQPVRSAAIELEGLILAPAVHYADWQFIYQPPLTSPPVQSTPGPRR